MQLRMHARANFTVQTCLQRMLLLIGIVVLHFVPHLLLYEINLLLLLFNIVTTFNISAIQHKSSTCQYSIYECSYTCIYNFRTLEINEF